jgi:hypothetical protein
MLHHVLAIYMQSRHGMAWHGMAWHGMAWHGMAWHGMDPVLLVEPSSTSTFSFTKQ